MAEVVRPTGPAEVAAMVAAGGAGGLIARGLGRSYGDAAQCAGGRVVDARGLGGVTEEAAPGLVTVGAGVTIDDLITWGLGRGWFVPVTPGTRQVTVGGAIAADIHGKNHHRDGSFGRHVTGLQLATPTGTVRVGPAEDPELFWATVGGMGLTGVVAEATLQMIPVETSWMVVDTERCPDLDAVMAAMESRDHEYRYSVAWVDCMTGGTHLGRAVLTRGEHAGSDELGAAQRRSPTAPPRPPPLRVPRTAPPGLLNRATVSAFNELWFRRAPRRQLGALHSASSFFHPLDGVAEWNLLYGPAGFLQYQFAVAPTQSEAVRRAVTLLSGSGIPSFLAVLKRFGEGTPGPLSFPTAGWTLALDFPIGPPGLPGLLDQLDELVTAAGGRVYLAKDSRLDRRFVGPMYPRLNELAAVRACVDPDGVLRSDLSRRLGLGEGR